MFSNLKVDDIIEESKNSSYVCMLESYKNPSPNKNVSREDDALISTSSRDSKQSNVPPTNTEASLSFTDGLISWYFPSGVIYPVQYSIIVFPLISSNVTRESLKPILTLIEVEVSISILASSVSTTYGAILNSLFHSIIFWYVP